MSTIKRGPTKTTLTVLQVLSDDDNKTLEYAASNYAFLIPRDDKGVSFSDWADIIDRTYKSVVAQEVSRIIRKCQSE